MSFFSTGIDFKAPLRLPLVVSKTGLWLFYSYARKLIRIPDAQQKRAKGGLYQEFFYFIFSLLSPLFGRDEKKF